MMMRSYWEKEKVRQVVKDSIHFIISATVFLKTDHITDVKWNSQSTKEDLLFNKSLQFH